MVIDYNSVCSIVSIFYVVVIANVITIVIIVVVIVVWLLSSLMTILPTRLFVEISRIWPWFFRSAMITHNKGHGATNGTTATFFRMFSLPFGCLSSLWLRIWLYKLMNEWVYEYRMDGWMEKNRNWWLLQLSTLISPFLYYFSLLTLYYSIFYFFFFSAILSLHLMVCPSFFTYSYSLSISSWPSLSALRAITHTHAFLPRLSINGHGWDNFWFLFFLFDDTELLQNSFLYFSLSFC